MLVEAIVVFGMCLSVFSVVFTQFCSVDLGMRSQVFLIGCSCCVRACSKMRAKYMENEVTKGGTINGVLVYLWCVGCTSKRSFEPAVFGYIWKGGTGLCLVRRLSANLVERCSDVLLHPLNRKTAVC